MPTARQIYQQAFPEKEIKGLIVFHKDLDKTNNEISNLKLITRKELMNWRNNRFYKQLSSGCCL